MIIPKEERSHSNLFYRKLYRVWWHMTRRCYNPKDTSYRLYGERGVVTSEKWKSVDGFFDDADSVPGWDKELFLSELLQLDKDLKIEGNKLYSLETCLWVHPNVNVGLRPNLMRPKIALTPDGERIRYFNTQELLRSHKLNKNAILDCLTYKIPNHHGWQFRYEDEEVENPFLDYYEAFPTSVIVMSPTGEVTKHISGADFLRSIGYDDRIYGGAISSVCAGLQKHMMGYQAQRLSSYDIEKFVDPKSIKGVTGRTIIGTYMDGTEIEFTDRKAFSETYGVSTKRIDYCVNNKRNKTNKSKTGWNFRFK